MLKKYLLSELIFLPLKNFVVHLVTLQEKSRSWLAIMKPAFLPFLWSGRVSPTGSSLEYSCPILPSSFLDEVHMYRN